MLEYNDSKSKENNTANAWNKFSQTGAIGAYLAYLAVCESERAHSDEEHHS